MSAPEAALREAIRRKICVTAIYNRKPALLAPHLMFERHGDLFVRAVTLEIEGRKPREAKLGTFKLIGLSEVSLTRKLFRPQADLLASAPEPQAASMVASVAPVAGPRQCSPAA